MRTLAAIVAIGLLASPARADTRVDVPIDATLAGLALLGGFLFYLIPVDTEARWEAELLPVDGAVKEIYSARSANLSDVLLVSAALIPMAAQLALGADERLGENALVFGEALAVSFLLNSAIKFLVQRPRPYVYHPDPRVRATVEAAGSSSHLSFYSGHSATGFTAAVAGAYLFGLRTRDTTARAVMWGVELALATATANLRVRAGLHFYSDAIVGAIAGSAVGVLLPFLHQPDLQTYAPHAGEWLAMAGGIVVGLAASQLLPLSSDVSVPLDGTQTVTRWRLAPLASPEGAGLMVMAEF